MPWDDALATHKVKDSIGRVVSGMCLNSGCVPSCPDGCASMVGNGYECAMVEKRLGTSELMTSQVIIILFCRPSYRSH